TASIIAMATVISIVGAELSGDAKLAGVPSMTIQLSAAAAATVWGLLWDRIGRRNGLSIGLVIGVGGISLSLVAVQLHSFPLFLGGLVGLGFARAAAQLGRFVAAEVNPPTHRGRAISYVVLGGTIGAVAGPLLVNPSLNWAEYIGWTKLAGPYALAILLFGISILIVQIGLRPEPQLIGRKVADLFPEEQRPGGANRSLAQLLSNPGFIVAVTSMVLGQSAMVMVMGITPLHMKDLGFFDAVPTAYMAHTIGMFAFSILSGRLADRWGRGQLIISGAIILLLSTIIAPMYPNMFSIVGGLFLLGLGWNFCFVGGSALLADQLSFSERTRFQGYNDLLVSLSAAASSLSSGFIYAGAGYGALNLAAAIISLVPLLLTLWWYFQWYRPQLELAAQ
ncbi:MAG: MFS transporter, partial [Anaerolineae bacterium]|nr:MFS transporter [Anaerolineae bacterium]